MRKSRMTTAMREQAEQAAQKLRQAEIEQRAAELAAKAQALSADLVAKAQPVVEDLTAKAQAKGAMAQAKGSELADRGLRRLGARLAQGRAGQRLGIQPAKRDVPWWLVGLLGVAIGYVIGLLTAPKRGEELRADIEAQATSVARPLAETVKAEITNDPRTSNLPNLRVDVADGTVFVRGTVPLDFDQNTLREVIERIPGVHDVDLQVSSG
jgi:F0F1-type ATP synthase membrane subunit b/b'